MPDDDKIETLSDNFPSNRKMENKKIPQEKTKEKKTEKVITGKVKTQKKSFGKKMAEIFLEDDTKSVGSYVFHDVLIPAAKEMISDMIGGGIEMLLFGERRGRGGSRIARQGGKSYTSYGSYYSQPSRDAKEKGREISKTGRSRHDFAEIVLETRGEAEEVLSNLVDLTIDYDGATVADLYGLVGIDSDFTDNKYGWTDLRTASVSRVRGGYLINLPRTQPFD